VKNNGGIPVYQSTPAGTNCDGDHSSQEINDMKEELSDAGSTVLSMTTTLLRRLVPGVVAGASAGGSVASAALS
jgi:hypothetical protein